MTPMGNPFKALYKRFGLRKLILIVVAVFVILLPSILAAYLIINSEINDTVSSNELTVVMYSSDNEELFRETENEDIDEEESLVDIFSIMQENLIEIDSIPTDVSTSNPIHIEMISGDVTDRLTYYFLTTREKNYCLWNDKAYEVFPRDSKRFFTSRYAELLYKSATPPQLITVDGEPIIPHSAKWYFRNVDEKYVEASGISFSDRLISYDITGGLSLTFSSLPDSCTVSVYEAGQQIFIGSLDEAQKIILHSDIPLSVNISAVWNYDGDQDYYGNVIYDFNVIIHSRAEFSVSSDTIQKNGFTVFKATNIIDLSRLSFSCDELSFIPKFHAIGTTVYAVIPYTESNDDQTLEFTATYGASSQSFSIAIIGKELPSNADIVLSAKSSGAIPNTTPDYHSPIFLFGDRVSPTSNEFSIHNRYGDLVNEKYTYCNTYKYSGVNSALVSAVCGGKVTEVGSSHSLGNYAVVDIGLGLSLVYSDMSVTDDSVGDLLSVGDPLGKVGVISENTSGFSLMLIFDGAVLDPNVLFN